MNQESIKRLLSWVLNPNGNTVIIYLPILRSLGIAPAVVLGVLVWAREREESEEFKLPFAIIEKRTGLRTKRIRASIENLRSKGLIEAERQGSPPYYVYRINFEAIMETVEKSTNSIGAETASLKGPKGNLQRGRNGPYNTITSIDIVSKDILGISKENTSKSNSIMTTDKKTPHPEKINDVILPILREAVRLGGFKNTFPGPGKVPTKALISAQKFLQSAFSGRLNRDYPINAKEGEPRSFARYLKESGRTLEDVLYEICARFNDLRGPDYGNKKLTTDISTFFYNPIMRQSWFLTLVFDPPKKLGSKIIEKDFDALALSEKTLLAVSELRGKNWDSIVFKKKVMILYDWYSAKKDDLQIYAAYLGVAHLWAEHFGSFKALCEQIKEFAQGWDDWKPSNFGYGNATWDRFVIRVREDYQGLDLSPPARKLEVAKAQWYSNQSEQAAKDKKYAAENKSFEEQTEAFRKGLLEEGDE